MRHLSTVLLLIEWARWGASHNIDYPTMSPMFGERALKSPLYGIGHIPDDVLEVEQAVCELDWEHRQAIILRYQHHLSFALMGMRIGRTKWAARDRLKRAVNDVHHNLSKKLVRHSPTGICFDPQSNPVSA